MSRPNRIRPHTPCAGQVIDRYGTRDCVRSASEYEGGQHWCVQHAPSRVRARRDRQIAERSTQADRLRAQYIHEGIDRAIEALDAVGRKRFGEARAILVALKERTPSND